ncbi:MAG: TonB-dependent receptor plug domain-containing protein [Bacteroidales bacterium]|nr:TonB-dependent receptor plug domain-containing protein [Bacteroidales bacterium]
MPQDNHQNTIQDNRLDSIIVSAQRAGMKTPVTFSQVSGKELRKNSQSHSLPMMLNLQPSVVATTEGGLGLGYTKMSVRGTDDTRTNVTINGIAMNDSESQQVFWVNLPSIHSFLGSAQLQRGVGTSSNGAGAFGASLNLPTSSGKPDAYGAAEVSAGSYGTFMNSFAAGTGISPKGFSFDAIYSHGQTDGYIRNAKADLNSLYLSGRWEMSDKQIKLSYIFGDQVTGITWEGISPQMYEVDRRYNVAGEYYDEEGNVHYYDNETDNYRQHYVQGSYTQAFGNFLSWNTTFNFTKGDGYYENYKADTKFSKYGLEPVKEFKKSDFIVQQAMDNRFYAVNTGLVYDKVGLKASAAVSYSYYDGNHFGDMLWCKHLSLEQPYRWYENNGTKQDYSAYIKGEMDFASNFTAFADLQYRGITYVLSGMDKDLQTWTGTTSTISSTPKGVSLILPMISSVFMPPWQLPTGSQAEAI